MSNTGWICPRCQKVHAPFVQTCNCAPSPVGTLIPSSPKPDPIGWPLKLPETCSLTDYSTMIPLTPFSYLNNFVVGDGLARTSGGRI